MSKSASLMTFAEFEQLPDLDAGKRELVNGEAVTAPPPKKTHSDIAMRTVEVLSPGEDIDSKITLYLHGGAREVWVINPRLGTLVVYTAEARIEVVDEYRSALVEQAVALADVSGQSR